MKEVEIEVVKEERVVEIDVVNLRKCDIDDPTTTLEFVERVNEDGGTVTNLNKVLNELNNVTDENLLMIPSGRKEGVLYSQLPTDGSGDFTVNRNSPVWIENSEGVLVEVPANVPVFDKNGNLVVQGQGTNLIRFSEDYSENIHINGWVHSAGEITFDKSYLAPNGTYNATRIENSNVVGGSTVNYNMYGAKSNTDYVASFFVKNNGGTRNYIGLIDVDNNITVSRDYTSEINSETFTRISITIKTGDSADRIAFNILRDTPAGTTDFIAFGAQLEEGTEPTSYIPTNETAETRLADEITVTPPSGTTEIIETINGVENTITTIPVTYQISEGLISKIVMK